MRMRGGTEGAGPGLPRGRAPRASLHFTTPSKPWLCPQRALFFPFVDFSVTTPPRPDPCDVVGTYARRAAESWRTVPDELLLVRGGGRGFGGRPRCRARGGSAGCWICESAVPRLRVPPVPCPLPTSMRVPWPRRPHHVRVRSPSPAEPKASGGRGGAGRSLGGRPAAVAGRRVAGRGEPGRGGRGLGLGS